MDRGSRCFPVGTLSQLVQWTVYMIETIPIIDGFNHFAEWAENGGTTYTDWYKDKSGYINWENIYTEP